MFLIYDYLDVRALISLASSRKADSNIPAIEDSIFQAARGLQLEPEPADQLA